MKRVLFAFLLFPFSLIAQTISFNIQGLVKDTKGVKFAYLTTKSQQVPISSDKIFMVVPVVDGKFSLKGTFDLAGKDMQQASVFLDERGNISKEEVNSKFNQLIWITGKEDFMKNIVLEDLMLEIPERNQLKTAKIVSGGKLTQEREDLSIALMAHNKKLVDFVKKHPDSPVSFMAVHDRSGADNPKKRDYLESIWGSPKELYDALSPRLKNSIKGKALKKRVDAY